MPNAANISMLKSQTNFSRPEKISLSPALYSRQSPHDWNANWYYVYNYGLQLTIIEPIPAKHTGKYVCQAIPKHAREEERISTPSLTAEIDINIMNGMNLGCLNIQTLKASCTGQKNVWCISSKKYVFYILPFNLQIFQCVVLGFSGVQVTRGIA